MKTTIALAALALVTTSAALPAASAAEPGRDMTCRGELEVWGTPSRRTVGRCFIESRNEEAAKIVDAACEENAPCVLRVRAALRDTPHGIPQTYNVLKLYSARRETR